MSDPSRGFVAGFSAAMRGLRIAMAAPGVRRAYLQLVAALLALVVVLDILGIWGVLRLTAGEGGSWWAAVGLVLLRLAGIAIVLLAAPLLSMFVVNMAFPLLGERVFFAGLATVAPERAAELEARPGLPWGTAVAQNLLRLLLYLGLSIVALVLSFVPVVGSIGGPVLQTWLTARALGWELLDPYFEKLELRFDAQHDFVRRHRGPMVGFALPYAFVMAVPIVGPFAFGLAQAAAGVLVGEVLEAQSGGPT